MKHAHGQDSASLPLEEKGALHGFKVVDFGQYAAGPLVGALLADFGATVVRVDPPGGSSWKNPANVRMNLHKIKSVEIDLKKDLDRAIRMVADADVVIENFRPGVMKRLGLGSDVVQKLNPAVVYVSLPGFASDDKELKDFRAFEGIILARSGVFSDMGLNRTLMGIDPSYSPLMQASTYASALAAVAVTACLYRREKSGQGDVIEVPLASALLDALVYNAIEIDSVPRRYKALRHLEIDRRRKDKLPMNLAYDDITRLLDPFYATYFCKDGRPFYLVAPSHLSHQRRTLQILGLWEKLLEEGLPVNTELIMRDWDDSIRGVLGTYPISDPKWIRILKSEMTRAFKTRDANQWTILFGGMKIPAHGTLTTKEWMHCTHAKSSGLSVELENDVVVPGPFAWLGRSVVPRSKSLPYSPCPDVDEKNGSASKSVDDDSGLWLKDVRVLDLCNVIAGPMVGGTLARFGADVIKCDMAKPTYDASITTLLGLPANRGKRSILVDIHSIKGRVVLNELIAWADVVTVNQTLAQLTALKLDESSLKRVNPSVVMMHFDAFSGPRWGEWSDHLGYDDILQAVLGIMERFGGSLKTPEEHAHIGTIDVLGGFCGALSAIMALLKRRRTGRCDVARASLASAGNLLQINVAYDAPGYTETVARGIARGRHALYRWYVGKDGAWFFLACKDEDKDSAFKAICALPTFAPYISDVDALSEQRERVLGAVFKSVPTNVAISALRSTGIVEAVRRRTLEGLRKEHFVYADLDRASKRDISGKTFVFDSVSKHPIGSSVTMFATDASIRPKRGKILALGPAPKYGQHTREILRDVLKKNASAIGKLEQCGAVRTGWCDRYIPQGDPWRVVEKEYLEYVSVIDTKTYGRNSEVSDAK